MSALAVALLLGACSGNNDLPGSTHASATPSGPHRLAGWSEDNFAAALPAFLKSCERFLKQPDSSPLDPATQGGAWGRVADWRPLCAQARGVPAGDEAAARRFFESEFVPVRTGGNGLFTGYWEVEVRGSRQRGGAFQTPVYSRPADLKPGQVYLSRGEIEDGALAGRGLELLYVEDPADLLTLQTQGSGRVHLADGSVISLEYDVNNGRAPVAIDKLLVDHGAIPSTMLSAKTVRAWMVKHPDRAREIRRENPAFVFFRERKTMGPIGYEGAVLTPGRSLAVDHHYIPLGLPLWLETQDRFHGSPPLHRLVVAQDTGDGIEGPVRGDFFWGTGEQAASRGGNMYADGHYWAMLPRHLAQAQIASR